MNDGAVFSQWLHTYEMDAETLSSILSAVAKTFPEFVVYSSIDSDIILIARKGGAPGRFDAAVLGYQGLQPMLKKLKLTEPEVVQRRAVGTWYTLAPFFESLGAPSNSDYFPFVDHRASRTRFTRARVNGLVELQSSGVPMLEMLDGAAPPAERRHDTIPTTAVDVSVGRAWDLHDGVLAIGTGRDSSRPIETSHDMAARLVRLWAGCRAELTFEQVLPALRFVAEATSPYLPKSAATRSGAGWRNRPAKRQRSAEQKLARLFGRSPSAADAMIVRAGRSSMRTGPGRQATEFAFLATAMRWCAGRRGRRSSFDRAKAFVPTAHA
jgi:hypothetical protein